MQCTSSGSWEGHWNTIRAKQPQEAFTCGHQCSISPQQKTQKLFLLDDPEQKQHYCSVKQSITQETKHSYKP